MGKTLEDPWGKRFLWRGVLFWFGKRGHGKKSRSSLKGFQWPDGGKRAIARFVALGSNGTAFFCEKPSCRLLPAGLWR